ncbi:MAG: hypothetical protein DYG92_09955 [Leptolyngbya sp. PLA1]|nr:hypothetical protein [Leptolyngbya sp. PLA1]
MRAACAAPLLLLLLVAAASLFGPARASAQTPASTAFTYQGELASSGTPVNGSRLFRFRLYDASTGGAQVGPTLGATATVTNGRFAVELDFGASPFAGDARWLEIDVSEGAGFPFTTLAPRQAITATPYALFALNGNPGPQGPPGPAGIVASVTAQFSLNDRSAWTRIEALGDDQCHPNIPLGFTFTGWGRADSAVSVSSNGVLFFGGSQCSTSFSNQALPSAISQAPFLAFFWDDLRDYGTGEFIEYATLGSAPGRVFNLYFKGRLFSANCGADPINVHVSIHEGSNLIQVSYSGLSGCALIAGSSATFGLQAPNFADAYLVGFNAPILDNDAPRQSMSFTPPRQ